MKSKILNICLICFYFISFIQNLYSESWLLYPDKKSEFGLLLDSEIWIPPLNAFTDKYRLSHEFYGCPFFMMKGNHKKILKGRNSAYMRLESSYFKYEHPEILFFHFDFPNENIQPLNTQQLHDFFYLRCKSIYKFSTHNITYLGKSSYGPIFEVHADKWTTEKLKQITFRLYIIYSDPYCDSENVYHQHAYYIFVINKSFTSTEKMDELCKPIIESLTPIPIGFHD